MKVGELITELEKYGRDHEVKVYVGDSLPHTDINYVLDGVFQVTLLAPLDRKDRASLKPAGGGYRRG